MKPALLRLCFSLVTCISVVAAQGPGSSPERDGIVQGIVTRAGSSSPIPNATVTLTVSASSAQRAAPSQATTDPDGKFVYWNVQPGRYSVSVARTGYVRQVRPTIVSVTAGQQLPDIRLSLIPTATVFGRIIDENGEPRAANIQAMEILYRNGVPQMGGTANVNSDDRGEYRLTNLAPGKYYVRVRPISGGPPFTPVYYPGVAFPEEGVRLTVGAGAELGGINIRLLRSAESHTVTMNIIAPEPLPPEPRLVFMLRPSSRSFSVPSNSVQFQPTESGSYVSPRMGPGTYDIVVVARSPSSTTALWAWPSPWALRTVEIRDRDVDVGSVLLHSGPSVDGRIVIKDVSGLSFSQPQIYVALQALAGSPFPVDLLPPPSQVMPDGTFVIEHVPERPYHINIIGLPADIYVESIRYGGRDIIGSGLVADERSGLINIVVSGPPGKIEGVVRDSREMPLAGVFCVLLPPPGRRGPSNPSATVTSDEDGAFVFRGLAPGEYGVLALEHDVPILTTIDEFHSDPEFLKNFGGRADKVTVHSGMTSRASVRALPFSRE